MGGEVLVPAQFTCDLTDDTESDSLLERGSAEAGTSALAKALGTSLSMERAMRSTHKVFDDHGLNSSMQITLVALREAWHPFCDDVACDHTNYWDIYGVSHAHTASLIEAGASINHLRTHIKNRMNLELRVQKFLSAHGDKFAESAYRVDSESAHDQMRVYFAKGKAALVRDTMKFISSQEDDVTKVLRLLDEERFATFLAQQPNDTQTAILANDGTAEVRALAQMSAHALAAQEEYSQYGGRRRRRRRIFKAIGNAISSVVNAVVSFVKDLFACIGSVKSMAAVGYCKKFPLPTSIVGVGVGFGASIGEDLGSLLQGNRVPNIRIFMGMVVGAVPGSPVTGGLRTGIGVGGRVSCTPTTCNLGISVGAVAAALWPTADPACFFGSFLIGFRCMKGAGVSISIMCCHFDLVTGAENCC